jgi:hypothetical protein
MGLWTDKSLAVVQDAYTSYVFYWKMIFIQTGW